MVRPGIDFDTFILELLGIGNFLFFVDFAIRIYFSTRLIYKYWDSSSIDIPRIDLSKVQNSWNALKTSPSRLLFSVVFNKVTASIVLGFLGFSVLVLISSIYIPLYNEYISGCVNANGTGTFLTKNMYSMAYNFASRDGNKAVIEGLHNLDSSRIESCSEFRSTSAKNYQDEIISLASLKYSNTQTLAGMNLFERCLDVDNMDNLYQDACCGELGYDICASNQSFPELCPWNDLITTKAPFLSPGAYLDKDSCNRPLSDQEWILEDSIFNCSELPVCSITCQGPYPEILNRTTNESGCMAEWYIHSAWLQMTIAFLIYAISNISRIVTIEGLTRIFWNHLHPEIITFVSSCSMSGTITNFDEYSGNIAGLKESASNLIYRFKFFGYIMLIVGVSINSIWIYLLAYVGNNTAPWLR